MPQLFPSTSFPIHYISITPCYVIKILAALQDRTFIVFADLMAPSCPCWRNTRSLAQQINPIKPQNMENLLSWGEYQFLR